MTLQNQVTSLEISKKLKSLGVKQESLFDWCEIDENEWILMARKNVSEIVDGCVSAFTVAELGEMLKNNCNLPVWDDQTKVWLGYYKKAPSFGAGDYINADTEANARGKMLIYLLKNKIITSESDI